jgi:hypothetical protein
LEPGVKIAFGDKTQAVEHVYPFISEYSLDEVFDVLKFEFLKNDTIEFNMIRKDWGIRNRGELAHALQELIDDAAVSRLITLEKSMNPSMLTEAFMANVCGFYQPFIYHEFQKRDFETLLDQHPELIPLAEFKRKVLASSHYYFDALEDDLNSMIESSGINITKNKLDDFISKLKIIISGGSLENENLHPHWFDDDFSERWHNRYLALDKIIMEEYFPNVLKMNNETVKMIDPSENITTRLDETFIHPSHISIQGSHVIHALVLHGRNQPE